MRNHIKVGPVIIRIGSKHLAKWGHPRVRVGGLSVWSWTNTGQFMPAGYHPHDSITWLWSIWIGRNRTARWFKVLRPSSRSTIWLIGPLDIALMTQERMPRRPE